MQIASAGGKRNGTLEYRRAVSATIEELICGRSGTARCGSALEAFVAAAAADHDAAAFVARGCIGLRLEHDLFIALESRCHPLGRILLTELRLSRGLGRGRRDPARCRSIIFRGGISGRAI